MAKLRQGGAVVFKRNDSKTTQVDESKRFGDVKVLEPEYAFDELIEIYDTNNIARKCIELFAKNVVGNGFSILPEDTANAKENEKLEIDEFFLNCNPEKTFAELNRNMIIDLMTTGSAGLEIGRSKLNQNKVSKFFNIPISTLRVAKGGKDMGFRSGERFIQNESFNALDESVWFNRYYPNKIDRTPENGYDPFLNGVDKVTNEVLFFTLPNPKDRFYGKSPSITLLRTYLISKYAEEFNISEFESGMLNKFLIAVRNGFMTDESLEGLKAFMKELIEKKQWSSIPILRVDGENAGVDVHKLTNDVKEGSFLNIMKFNREEVYIAFGVPPILLSITENSTLANQSAQERKFFQSEVRPLQVELNYRYTKMIKEDLGFPNWFFEWGSPDLRDEKAESEIASQLISEGAMSINEKREMLGYERLEEKGADEYYKETNMGLINVKDLNSLTKEEVEKMEMINTAKIFTNLRNVAMEKAKEEKIRKGVEDGGEPYPQ
jgi:capsid portal protein